MEQRNESMRDRLLARLPQPENLEAYRQETASLLARHEKAIYWEKATGNVILWLAVALWIMVNSTWGPKLDVHGTILLNGLAVVLFFTGALNMLGYYISRSKVDLLKELKQVQLQVLELQASLRKTGGE